MVSAIQTRLLPSVTNNLPRDLDTRDETAYQTKTLLHNTPTRHTKVIPQTSAWLSNSHKRDKLLILTGRGEKLIYIYKLKDTSFKYAYKKRMMTGGAAIIPLKTSRDDSAGMP